MSAYTISTQNGSQANRDHNNRNPKTVEGDVHINPFGLFEIWLDENPRDAYKRLFGKDVREYNERQKRADRKIRDYYSATDRSRNRHAVYEMIIQIGSRSSEPDRDTGKAIMLEFVRTWPERNPNLEMIGAYYHADEEGAPHVHIDYVPVAHGYKTGPSSQPGLVKALSEQGIPGHSRRHSKRDSAQVRWVKRENQYFERLCSLRGLAIEHPCVDGVKHLETSLYKKQQALKQAENELAKAREELEHTRKEHEALREETSRLLMEGDRLRREYGNYEKLRNRFMELYKEHEDLRRFCDRYEVNNRPLLQLFKQEQHREAGWHNNSRA